MPFVKHEPAFVNAPFKRLQAQARGRIIDRPVSARNRKEGRATPIGACAGEQYCHLTPVNFVTDDIEVGRAQWLNLRIGDLNQYNQHRESPAYREFFHDPAIEIANGFVSVRNRHAASPAYSVQTGPKRHLDASIGTKSRTRPARKRHRAAKSPHRDHASDSRNARAPRARIAREPPLVLRCRLTSRALPASPHPRQRPRSP